ncbi:MAG: hypothetical protein SFU99_10900 [Saprospiraceae bacterium]|nr:hypothetical protein [Saprospiraceae bacterium]
MSNNGSIIKTREPKEIGLLYGLAEADRKLNDTITKLTDDLGSINKTANDEYLLIKGRFDNLFESVQKTKKEIEELYQKLREMRELAIVDFQETILRLLPIELDSDHKYKIIEQVISAGIKSIENITKSIFDSFETIRELLQQTVDLKANNEIKEAFRKFLVEVDEKGKAIVDLRIGYADGEAIRSNFKSPPGGGTGGGTSTQQGLPPGNSSNAS